MIPFNKPSIVGNEIGYIQEAISNGKLSGNGIFTKKCQTFFEDQYNIKKALLTTSCTDALEMCSILAEIKPGDEIIIPSYTFVSTALAFIRQGATVVFADSKKEYPALDEETLRPLINDKTRAIVPVHYAGVACNMDEIMKLASEFNLIIIEDAAQAIDSFYNNKPLGSIGHMSTFSFHETKNINAGEGGLLAINDDRFINRSEIIWEKGTNRAEFFRGEVNKYEWVDIGSSFLPSEITAAYLWAQLENLRKIQKKRINIWHDYYNGLKDWASYNNIKLPYIPDFASVNGHMFYILTNSLNQRNLLIAYLKKNNILAVPHYLSLHSSKFYKHRHDGRELHNSDIYTDCLLRLPLYYELDTNTLKHIIKVLCAFDKGKSHS